LIRSFYWHDYETFGVDPAHDRPSQFAGLRTDADLNPIGEPLILYCKPAEDYLPSPEACLITGITPQKALADGVCEAEFIARIEAEFREPGTCVVGYNSLKFDDEVTRFTLYRNLRDPYAREWQQGCSRWDIIDMVRLTYALRPEGIEWPRREDGSPSFRLEELTKANGIIHEAAHDALSDVEATIALARLIREKQPKLFNFVLANKDKKSARGYLDTQAMKPVLHVSSRYPGRLGCCALVLPLVDHPQNNNAVIVVDLRQNPDELIAASVEDIQRRVFTREEDLPEGQTRFALKAVHTNKCPILAPAAVLKDQPANRLAELELDGEILRQHLAKLRAATDLPERLRQAFDRSADDLPERTDPDDQLYSGGFLSDGDRQTLNQIAQLPPEALAEQEPQFSDPRLEEMLFRYRARNFPETLSGEEQEQWEQFRQQRLMNPPKGWLSLPEYGQRLQKLAQQPDLPQAKLQILEELQFYGESVMPYV